MTDFLKDFAEIMPCTTVLMIVLYAIYKFIQALDDIIRKREKKEDE